MSSTALNGERCPEDDELAAFAAGGLRSDRHDRVVAHVAWCDECLDDALAARDTAEGPLSAALISRIEALAPTATGTVAAAGTDTRRLVARRIVTGRHRAATRRLLASDRESGAFGYVAAAAAAVLLALLFTSAPPRPSPLPAPVAAVVPPRPLAAVPSSETPAVLPQSVLPGETPTPEPVDEETAESVPPPASRPAESPRPADPSPAAPPRSETIATDPAPVRLERVSGSVFHGDRPARAGDVLRSGEELHTPYGRHGVIAAAGTTIALHHRTRLALGPGREARLLAGSVFIQDAPGFRLETLAARVTPIGTAFTVDVADDGTTVSVREGSVLVENARGRAMATAGRSVRCLRDRAPAAPVRIADPEACFAWAGRVEADRYLMLYPASRTTGAVVAAPHTPAEVRCADYAAAIAERLELPCVIGHGYAGNGGESRVVVDQPGDTAEEKALYGGYLGLLREAAGGAPPKLLIEVHDKFFRDPSPAIVECRARGFTAGERERLHRSFEEIVRKSAPDFAVTIRITDFRPLTGSFSAEGSVRGLRLALPFRIRSEAKLRGQYMAILGEWLGGNIDLK